MATVTRSTTTGSTRSVAAPRRTAPPVPSLKLPTQPTQVVDDINAYSYLIHGQRKAGKTTLATQEPDVLLLTYDPLQLSRSLLQLPMKTWSDCETTLGLLERAAAAGTYPYSKVVLDGAGIWAERGKTHIAKTVYNLNSWNDIDDYGNEWGRLQNLLDNTVVRLLALPGRCLFIAHSEWKQVKSRRGDKIEKLVPIMDKRADNVLVGMTDLQGAYEYDGAERVLVIQGDETITAGHRISGHFLSKDGKAIVEIPMGNSPEEAWANFQTAFHNKQPYTSLAERDLIRAQAAKAARRTLPQPGNGNGAVRQGPARRPQRPTN